MLTQLPEPTTLLYCPHCKDVAPMHKTLTALKCQDCGYRVQTKQTGPVRRRGR